MILDRMENVARYEGILPFAKEIAALWASRNTDGLPFELRDKSYATKPDDKRRFEVHDHTVDMMVGLEGGEFIHICPEETLEPAEALPNGADGRKLNGAPQGSAVLLEAGWFVAIYPHEAHMVGGQTQPGVAAPLHKWVLKLPL